jgi:two-component system NtrC family sensor kinase
MMTLISPDHSDCAGPAAAGDGVLTEQQLVQIAKLAAIGELTAGVAHEVNNPLFAILGLVEFLLNDAEPGTKTHRRLELVQSTAHEIKEIIRALLDFARESSDERAVVGLEDVIHETVGLVRKTTASHGVEIVEELDGGPFLVNANANQLKQIFLSLIGNARQAMPNDGTIRVSLTADADAVTAVVRADCPGLPEHLPGTGLGLAVGAAIAKRHGGSVTAEGAAFILRLPSHRA